MKQQHRDSQPNDEGEERRRTSYGFDNRNHYCLLRLAIRFKESGSSVQGTSIDSKRTHPLSVVYTLESCGCGSVDCFRVGGIRIVEINIPMITPATTQGN